MNRQYVSGCTAVAMAVSLSEADVVAAYPITPQTSIVELLASKIAAGELRAQMVHVESEHSAMSVCVGAACVGAWPFTASCGQGLAYMKEPVFWAAGLRLPIVMAITNRSLLGPNTIFCDHQDFDLDPGLGLVAALCGDLSGGARQRHPGLPDRRGCAACSFRSWSASTASSSRT